VPLILPLAYAYKVDPYHLAVIFLLNLELGFLIPPVGMNLFISSIRFAKSVTFVIRSVMPSLAILSVTLMIVTYVPWISTYLPSLLKIQEEGVSLGGGYVRLTEDEEGAAGGGVEPDEPLPEDDGFADEPDGGVDGGQDAGADGGTAAAPAAPGPADAEKKAAPAPAEQEKKAPAEAAPKQRTKPREKQRSGTP
jgi:hypothetical protein